MKLDRLQVHGKWEMSVETSKAVLLKDYCSTAHIVDL